MLLITFSKAASRELRERVRCQIVDAVAALEGRQPRNELERYLVDADGTTRTERRARLRDALAGFDASTIVTRPRISSVRWCSNRLVWPETATPARRW